VRMRTSGTGLQASFRIDTPRLLLSHPFRKSAKWMGHGCDGYSCCVFASRTFCRSSGRSIPYCCFRHIRRTTSSPFFLLALEGSGRTDRLRPGPAGPSHTTVEESGAEDSGAEDSGAGDSRAEDTGVGPRARAGRRSAGAAHRRRKSWTGGLPLLHSAGRRQAKVGPRRSP